MKLTEQQVALIHARVNVFLSIDALRPEESRHYDANSLDLLTKILDSEYYWALNFWQGLFSFDEESENYQNFGFIERPKYVQEVFTILEMFRKYEDIRDQFKGFDAHEETDQYCVLELIIFDFNRYKEFTKFREENTVNSHWPMLSTYRDLLKEHSYLVYDPT